MPGANNRGSQANHRKVADECRRRPGEWVYVNDYAALYTARSMCSTIRGGRSNTKITAYGPDGDFEARYDMVDKGWAVYAMYVVDGE